MLWLSVADNAEATEDTIFSIRWSACGFGIFRVEAWCRQTRLNNGLDYVGDFDEMRTKARQACVLHAGNWLS